MAEGIKNITQQHAVKKYFKHKDTGRLLVKGWKTIYPANIDQRKAVVVTLV